MRLLSTTLVLFIATIPATTRAQTANVPHAFMCSVGQLVFAEDFEPATVSDRWGFKADFALRDGALLRTNVNPTEAKRVFLKDASFHNTIIQFDFRFSGKTTDLRLVTGSGGHYNSVTQIYRDHFQLNTPVDRDAGWVPAQLGECSRIPRLDQWQTMTVEYWGDEMFAHLSDSEFIVGKHPIVDRTREYFAFQFDLPGASIDNVRIWKATGQRDDWAETRKKLTALQNSRPSVERNPLERFKVASVNLKSRLTLGDPRYRELVAKHDKLKAALHTDYAEAFATHKALGKRIAKKRKQLRDADPSFKKMEVAVHKARKVEEAYVLSTKPQLADLKEDGVAKQRFISELGQVRAEMEAAGDGKLTDLVAETAKRQAELEARFPDAFKSVDAAVATRQKKRKALNNNPDFQTRNREVVDAGQAIKDYEANAAPELSKLTAEAKAYTESMKHTER